MGGGGGGVRVTMTFQAFTTRNDFLYKSTTKREREEAVEYCDNLRGGW